MLLPQWFSVRILALSRAIMLYAPLEGKPALRGRPLPLLGAGSPRDQGRQKLTEAEIRAVRGAPWNR